MARTASGVSTFATVAARTLIACSLIACALAGCKKKDNQQESKKSPTLPDHERHFLWLEQFPSCPGGAANMLAHHIKIKVDEGPDRVTTAHFVRAPVKTYEGLNLIVKKRPNKVTITFGQCKTRSDDPQFRCDDDTQIDWYAPPVTIDVDPAKHQTVPFTPPPKLDCVKGEAKAEIISIVAQRPGTGAGSAAGSATGSAAGSVAGSAAGSAAGAASPP